MTYQDDPTLPWQAAYGDFVQRELVDTGKWPAEKVARYARQAVEPAVQLFVRPSVAKGKEIPARLQVGPCRIGSARTSFLKCTIVNSGEFAGAPGEASFTYSLSPNSSMGQGTYFAADPSFVGKRVLALSLACEVLCATDRPMASWSMSVRDECEVADAGRSVSRTSIDPPASVIRGKIVLTTSAHKHPLFDPSHKEKRSPFVCCDAKLDKVPHSLCFAVYARNPALFPDPANEQRIGRFVDINTNFQFSREAAIHARVPADLVVNDTIDLVLRFDPDLAERQVDDRIWWDGEIVFEGVQVLWPPESSAAPNAPVTPAPDPKP